MIKPIYAIIGTVVALALALAHAPAMAQTSSFKGIAKQALATHPAILARLSFSAAAAAELDGASWQRYPTPSLEVNSDNNGVTTGLLRVQQPLWAGGRIDAGIYAADSRHQASTSAVRETQQEILLRVIAAYVEALRQQAREDTLERNVREHERLLGLITRRVEHEASPRVDLELAQSRLYQAKNELSQVTLGLANALTQLSELSGMNVRRVSELDAQSALAPQYRESMLDQALAWSPTLSRLGFEEEAAKAEVESRRSVYKPQVSLRFESSHASAPLNGNLDYTTNRVMLVLEAQTGAGLSARSGVEAALGRLDAARQQRAVALRDLQERLLIDWDELTAARERYENATLASRSAKEVYESYARQYTAGRKTWLDVLNTVRESALSDIAATDANAQAEAAALRLKLLSGNLTGISE
ncbi:MAG: TolC family protein [Burkholderiales bacterium]|nr:TolC family protein [Burkholderiales bacterium]